MEEDGVIYAVFQVKSLSHFVLLAEPLPSRPVGPFLPPVGKTENTFTDVTQRDWYYDAVEFVYENGLMNGMGEGLPPA